MSSNRLQVHTRIHCWGLFLCALIDVRKARQRELAAFDEKSTSSGIAEPMRDNN